MIAVSFYCVGSLKSFYYSTMVMIKRQKGLLLEAVFLQGLILIIFNFSAI